VDSWKKGFYAVCAAELLAVTGFNTSVPIIPFFIQDELAITDPAAVNLWVGACATAVAVALAVFAPIWGRLADSYGKRLMLLRAMAGGTLVMGLMGVANAPWQLLVLRAMQGALTGTVSAATVLVATLSPAEEAGASLGLLATAVYIGSSLGPAIGGILSDLFGHRATFFATAAMILAGGLVIMRFVPRDAAVPRESGPFWRRALPDLGVIGRTPALAAILLVSAVIQVATSLVVPVLPLFIQSITPNKALVASTTGLIFGVSALTAALAAAALGRASARVGYVRMLALCLAGAFLTTLPQAIVHTPLQLLLLRAAGGAFLGGTMPALNALIARTVEHGKQGNVYGLSSSVNAAGAAVGPMIGAAVASSVGYPWVFVAMSGVLLAAGGAGIFLRAGARGRAAAAR
jgi:MFS transporter, DHA1 family, multidrug resistance protein